MEQTDIEKHLEKILKKKLGKDKGMNYYSDYQSARKTLIQDVLPNIKAKEPNLTDHGEKHIENVLNNAWRLLTYDEEIKKYDDINELTCHDLYILCLSILFHDAGNINGRTDHNKKLLDIYDEVRKKDSKFNSEKRLILKATKAHCGKTDLGSFDTLNVIEEKDSLAGNPIKLREIASILRFADELAEGPQRTSDYLLNTDKIPEESKKHHKYAQVTEVFIDRGNGRIALKYHINISEETTKISLKELLTFAYERILKLDEERKYTKFYSNLLIPFKKTEFTFNFIKYSKSGEQLDITINGVLPDVPVIKDEKELKAISLIDKFKDLDIDVIVGKLNLEE
jgi:hypothetical protein